MLRHPIAFALTLLLVPALVTAQRPDREVSPANGAQLSSANGEAPSGSTPAVAQPRGSFGRSTSFTALTRDRTVSLVVGSTRRPTASGRDTRAIKLGIKLKVR